MPCFSVSDICVLNMAFILLYVFDIKRIIHQNFTSTLFWVTNWCNTFLGYTWWKMSGKCHFCWTTKGPVKYVDLSEFECSSSIQLDIYCTIIFSCEDRTPQKSVDSWSRNLWPCSSIWTETLGAWSKGKSVHCIYINNFNWSSFGDYLNSVRISLNFVLVVIMILQDVI